MLKPYPEPERWTCRICKDAINPETWHKLWGLALKEDLEGYGLNRPPAYATDITTQGLQDSIAGSTLSASTQAYQLVAREPLVVCGLQDMAAYLATAQPYDYLPKTHNEPSVPRAPIQLCPAVPEGQACPAGTVLGTLSGPTCALLTLERPLLNLLQHLSGISTLTQRYLQALDHPSPTRLLDTRKTLPGYRVLQKYAVATAGGWNHRFGLYDRILFKDNHWAVLQQHSLPLSAVLRHYRLQYPRALVQVEVDTLDQLQEALAGGTDGVLLDNFTPEALHAAVVHINKAGRPVWVEASGNLHPSHLAYLQTLGLHGLACGRIIHQAQWVDIGLDAL